MKIVEKMMMLLVLLLLLLPTRRTLSIVQITFSFWTLISARIFIEIRKSIIGSFSNQHLLLSLDNTRLCIDYRVES